MNVGTVLSTILGGPQGPAPEVEGAQGPPPAGALPAFGQLLALLSAHGGDPTAAETTAGGTGETPSQDAGGPVTGEELKALLALLTGAGQGEVRLDRPAEAGRSREQEADDPPAGDGDGMTDGADYALLLALAAGVLPPPPATDPARGLPGLNGEQPPEPGALPVPAHAGRAADGVPQGRPAVQAVEPATAWAGADPAAQGTEATGTAVHVTLGEEAPPSGEAPPITARDLALHGRTDPRPSAAAVAPAERQGTAPDALPPVMGPAPDAAAGGAPAPAAPAEAERPGGPADRAAEAQRVIDQVAEAMEVLARDEGHEVRLRLRPPELGELHVRLDVRGATVTVSVAAEHEHVADLLRSHLPGLREALHQREIHVDQALVWTGTSADSPWSGRGDGRGGTGERPPYAALPWEAPRAELRDAPRPQRPDGERLVDYRI